MYLEHIVKITKNSSSLKFELFCVIVGFRFVLINCYNIVQLNKLKSTTHAQSPTDALHTHITLYLYMYCKYCHLAHRKKSEINLRDHVYHK